MPGGRPADATAAAESTSTVVSYRNDYTSDLLEFIDQDTVTTCMTSRLPCPPEAYGGASLPGPSSPYQGRCSEQARSSWLRFPY